MIVKLNILRSDPESGEKPVFQLYTLELEPDATVASALQYIYENIDPSLGFRFVCNCQKCAECAVVVNGAPYLACEKIVEAEMTIEPLANLPVLKDLVIDRTQVVAKPMKLLPFLTVAPDTKHLKLETLETSKIDAYYKLTACMQCLICQSVCTGLKNEPDRFAGPLGLVWLGQNCVIGTDHWEEKIRQALQHCVFCGNCWTACPRGENIPGEFFQGMVIAPCRYACPAGIDVPQYIRFIKEGKFVEAVDVIREKIPFPAVCGHICSHPCEAKCRRAQLDEPIAIKELKNFVSKNYDTNWKPKKSAATGKRIAIVGSGPAGLTAAYYLARLGYAVTIFESLSQAGGMMRVGIPRYRLPTGILEREINCIKQLGVEIKLNSKVESLKKLKGFDVIFIAIGAHIGVKLGIQGENLIGVMDGVSFQRQMNLGADVKLGKRVLVLGGGNVAIDCARTARRMGASDVLIACLESADCMLATPEEIKWACEEGVKFHNSKTFTRIVGNNGYVTGVECLDVQSFMFDNTGKLNVETVSNSEHIIGADTVIIAVGQRADLGLIKEINDINITSRHTIAVDQVTQITGNKRLFAGGDVVSGPSSVIEAIAAGRRAAVSIDRYLGGNGNISETQIHGDDDTLLTSEIQIIPLVQREKKSRKSVSTIPLEQRLNGFEEVELGYNAEQAMTEASRCLMCDIELQELSKH